MILSKRSCLTYSIESSPAKCIPITADGDILGKESHSVAVRPVPGLGGRLGLLYRHVISVAVDLKTKFGYILNCQLADGFRAGEKGHVDRHCVAVGQGYVSHLSKGPLFGSLFVVASQSLSNSLLRSKSNVYFPMKFLKKIRKLEQV